MGSFEESLLLPYHMAQNFESEKHWQTCYFTCMADEMFSIWQIKLWWIIDNYEPPFLPNFSTTKVSC